MQDPWVRMSGRALRAGRIGDACGGGGAVAGACRAPADLPAIAGACLEARIASGRTGSVYRGRMQGGRDVAIKVGTPGAAQRASWALFLQERWLLDRLDHPGIVRAVGDGCTEDGRPWIATEMVEGERIDVSCARRSCADGARIQMVMQVLDALDHAHSNGVVHRDVKPPNVLVDGTGSATLIDFGAALDLEQADPSFDWLVTSGNAADAPGCMSPEQADPSIGPLGPGVDIYQAAVLLYLLLTGELPYRERSRHPSDRVHAARSPDRVSIAARRPELRGALAAVIDRALDRDPGRRPASAREFCMELMDSTCTLR